MALEANEHLEELRLAVRIGDQAEEFASALEQNKNMKVLILAMVIHTLYGHVIFMPPLSITDSSVDPQSID